MAYYKYKTTPVTGQIWVHVYSMILQQDDGFGTLIDTCKEPDVHTMGSLFWASDEGGCDVLGC